MDAELRDAVLLNDEALLLRQHYHRASSGELVCMRCACDRLLNGFLTHNRLVMQAANGGKKVVIVGDPCQEEASNA